MGLAKTMCFSPAAAPQLFGRRVQQPPLPPCLRPRRHHCVFSQAPGAACHGASCSSSAPASAASLAGSSGKSGHKLTSNGRTTVRLPTGVKPNQWREHSHGTKILHLTPTTMLSGSKKRSFTLFGSVPLSRSRARVHCVLRGKCSQGTNGACFSARSFALATTFDIFGGLQDQCKPSVVKPSALIATNRSLAWNFYSRAVSSRR